MFASVYDTGERKPCCWCLRHPPQKNLIKKKNRKKFSSLMDISTHAKISLSKICTSVFITNVVKSVQRNANIL